jgi:thermostable 8-oxoguanine DNA glycosylase
MQQYMLMNIIRERERERERERVDEGSEEMKENDRNTVQKELGMELIICNL